MISLILTLFTVTIATDSTASQVAFSELTLASNPSVGVGLTTQLVADAFKLLDLDKNNELSADEMAPVILPLMKIFAGNFADDSGAYVLQEKFVNHLYVPDLSTISGTVGDLTCAADSMLVNLDSSTLWTGVFGDTAHVEVETFAETVYSIIAEGHVLKHTDLESLMQADLPTETLSKTLLDEYTVGNENCATSDEGRRNLVGWYSCLNWMNSGYGQLFRFGFTTVFSSSATCIIESQMGSDCSQSWGAAGRAIGVGSGVAGLLEGIPFFMRRYSIWPFITCPVNYEAPLEPVVIGAPRFPYVPPTPHRPEFDPADFEAPDLMEGPELGEIATGAGEAITGAAEAAGVAEGGAAVAEGAAAAWGVLETIGLAGLFG